MVGSLRLLSLSHGPLHFQIIVIMLRQQCRRIVTRFSQLLVSAYSSVTAAQCLDPLDDPFNEGLQTCLLQDLHDDPCSLEPRPWVPLPPSFHLGNPTVRQRMTSETIPLLQTAPRSETETPSALPARQSSDSSRCSWVMYDDPSAGTSIAPVAPAETEVLEESSEAAEILWLHDLLRDLVNKLFFPLLFVAETCLFRVVGTSLSDIAA
jgi:hypothetical protein